jgi:putative ABC transport system permease protein
MKTPDLLELAARNLRESLLRNSLTTLGIAVGVASLVAMLSLGVGLQKFATQRLQRAGLFDTVMVTRGDLGGFGPRARASATTDNNRALDENARREISQLPGVLEAVPDLRMMAQLRLDDKPHRTMVAALPMSARDREAFENIQGSFFSSNHAAEVIVQKRFAEELLGLAPSPEDSSNPTAPLPSLQPLLGKELVMAYAGRAALTNPPNVKTGAAGSSTTPSRTPRTTAAPGSATGPDTGADAMLSAFSVVPHTQTLHIVGIVTEDPDTLRGAGRARLHPARFRPGAANHVAVRFTGRQPA